MTVQYTISYDGHEARITPKLPDLIADRLSNHLSYMPVGAEFAKSHESQKWRTVNGKRVFNKKANWDGRVKLFRKGRGPYNHFPSGLIGEAMASLRPVLKSAILLQDQFANDRLPPATWLTLDGKQVLLKNKPVTIQIRPYQKEVVDALIKAPYGRAMGESPTGSGKSIIIGEICVKFPDYHILVTVPSLSLLHQTSADLEALLGEKVGIYGDGTFDPQRVTVATPDSINQGVKGKKAEEVIAWLLRVGVWILDESHLSAADIYQSISAFLPNTHYRFGVSATLRREDGAEMVFHGLVGPQVVKISPMRMIEEGWLVRPRIEIHVVEHEFEYDGPKKPKFDAVYKSQVVNNVDRNNLIFQQVYRCQQEGRLPVLVLVKDLNHGQILQDMIAQLGPTAYLQGEDKQEVREEVIAKVKSGEIPFLVASTIFDIGVDIPELRAVILAGSGKSASRAIQRVGRGLRPCPGKNDVLIIDFEDREQYFLRKHSMERKMWYQEYYPGCVTTWKNGKVLTGFGV